MSYAFAKLLLVRLYFYGLIQFNSSEFQSSLSSDRSATQQVKCEVTFILQCRCIITYGSGIGGHWGTKGYVH